MSCRDSSLESICVGVSHHRSPLIRPADQHHGHRQTENGPHGATSVVVVVVGSLRFVFFFSKMSFLYGLANNTRSSLAVLTRHTLVVECSVERDCTDHCRTRGTRIYWSTIFTVNRRRPRVRPWVFVQYQGRGNPVPSVCRLALVCWRYKSFRFVDNAAGRLYHVPDF